MKIKALAMAICLSLVLAMGCGGGATLYTLTTNAGKSYTTMEKPELNKDTKTYDFKDMDGNAITVNQDEVAEVKAQQQK